MSLVKIIDNMPTHYYQWMVSQVTGGAPTHYFWLLVHLDSIEFTYTNPMDENRYNDGLNLRRKYAYAIGQDPELVCEILEEKPCSILEMMVALAMRINNMMDDISENNFVGMWFWKMIECLGLRGHDDDHTEPAVVDGILFRFLNREYDSVTGFGSLFPNAKQDPNYAKTEIWYQMTGYLNQFI